MVSDSGAWRGDVFAGFWRRLVALAIDAVLLSLVVSALTSGVAIGLPALAEPLRLAVPDTVAFVGVNWIVWVLYDTVFHARTGRTLGKMAVGIEVRALGGGLPSFGASFVRTLVKFTLSAWVLYLGFLWAAWDRRKQAWHDKLAASCVVRPAPARRAVPGPPPRGVR